MPSPVDPSRRTALADALEAARMDSLACEVEARQAEDLQAIVARITVCGHIVEREWWWQNGKPLVRAIEAGHYGPWQKGER